MVMFIIFGIVCNSTDTNNTLMYLIVPFTGLLLLYCLLIEANSNMEMEWFCVSELSLAVIIIINISSQ